MRLLGAVGDELWTRWIRLRRKHNKPGQRRWWQLQIHFERMKAERRKRLLSEYTQSNLASHSITRRIQLQTFPASRVMSASSARARERKTDPPLMQGWSMRNYSLWFWVDCEDMGTIKVHCRGCLISPRSAESLAYALWPVINVNLCPLESAVHFHFQADQLYLVGLKSTSLPFHLTLKVRLKDPGCISPRTAAWLRTP